MERSYGVVWRRGDEALAHGRLELGPRSIRLIGTSAVGSEVVEIAYADIASVHVGRTTDERIDGHRTVALEYAGGEPISISSVAEPGAIRELADQLAELHGANVLRVTAIVVPLREGSRAAAERLLAEGPPFDPEERGLERHTVYLSDEEAVFVFEWRGSGSFEPLFAESAFWERLAVWHEHLAGPPRVAEPAYSWRHRGNADQSLLPPGLHA